MPLKLFYVSLTLDIDMMVLAEDEKQAKKSGQENWRDDVSNAGSEPSLTHVKEVSSRSQASWMEDEEIDGCAPYGVRGQKYENGCSSPQLGIGVYLAQIEAASVGACVFPLPDGKVCNEPVLGSLAVCYDHAVIGPDGVNPANPTEALIAQGTR